MKVNVNIQPGDLKVRLNRFFELAAQKIRSIEGHGGVSGASFGKGGPAAARDQHIVLGLKSLKAATVLVPKDKEPAKLLIRPRNATTGFLQYPADIRVFLVDAEKYGFVGRPVHRAVDEEMKEVLPVDGPHEVLVQIGQAGRNRHKGVRPQTRGVAMNPVDHPLGGGEGKSSGGRHPVSPWGKPEGRTRNPKKRSSQMIVRRRRTRGRRR